MEKLIKENTVTSPITADSRVRSPNHCLANRALRPHFLYTDSVVQLEGGPVVGSYWGDTIVPQQADHWATEAVQLGCHGGRRQQTDCGQDDLSDRERHGFGMAGEVSGGIITTYVFLSDL